MVFLEYTPLCLLLKTGQKASLDSRTDTILWNLPHEKGVNVASADITVNRAPASQLWMSFLEATTDGWLELFPACLGAYSLEVSGFWE